MRGRDDPGWWCRDNAALCPAIWWCSPRGYALSTLAGICLWAISFTVIARLVYPRVEAILERRPSKIREESGASWFAWHVQSTIHACCVVYMSFGPTVWLSGAGILAQFDPPSLDHPAYIDAIASIANASHVFFCYIIADTFVTVFRRAMTLDYLAHHAVFSFACLMIQFDCFAPYMAGWLLLMEISTVFLNGFSYFRNRLGYGHCFVKVCFVSFGSTFLACRLVGTTYITCRFAATFYRGHVAFDGIPRWHLRVLCAALAVAVGIQVYWAAAITRKLVKVLGSSTNHAEDGFPEPNGRGVAGCDGKLKQS